MENILNEQPKAEPLKRFELEIFIPQNKEEVRILEDEFAHMRKSDPLLCDNLPTEPNN